MAYCYFITIIKRFELPHFVCRNDRCESVLGSTKLLIFEFKIFKENVVCTTESSWLEEAAR